MNQRSLLDYYEAANRGELTASIPAILPTAVVYGNQISWTSGGAASQLVLAAWHAATSLRTLWLRRVKYNILSNSAAALVDAELLRITTAPTGGTVVTPFAMNADWAPETGGLTGMKGAITGGGAVAGVLDGQSYSLGITTGITSPTGLAPLLLGDYWPETLTEPPRARAGHLEGWALRLTASANTTLVVTASMEVSES